MCDMQQPGCSVLPETSGRLITLRQVAYTGEEHPRGASRPPCHSPLPPRSYCTVAQPARVADHLKHHYIGMDKQPSRLHPGLFASAPIARGTLVEASPCILIPPDQYHTHLRCAGHHGGIGSV